MAELPTDDSESGCVRWRRFSHQHRRDQCGSDSQPLDKEVRKKEGKRLHVENEITRRLTLKRSLLRYLDA